MWIPELSGHGPLYRQLADAIASAIERGDLPSGAKLPPQRHLADALSVTTGTVTRAYALAEQQGLVAARVGSGTYVREKQSTLLPESYFPVFPASDEHELIDLSRALPPPCGLREQALARAMNSMQRTPSLLRIAMDYPTPAVQAYHQQIFADWLGHSGRPVASNELLIDQGGMHGIYTCLKALLAPGERVAAEQTTYPGFISAVQQLSLKCVAIPYDNEGIDVDYLARACNQQPFRALYVMPDCQNPTTIRMSEARRQALAALARERQFWLIEDEATLCDEDTTPLYQLAPEQTITLFSMSKLLGSGLRVGVLRAPKTLHGRLVAALQAQSWMPVPLITSLVCQYIRSGEADTLLRWQRAEMAWRYERAMSQLGVYQPRGRKGAFYLWLPLPGELRASQLTEQLSQAGVGVCDADCFCPGNVAAPQAIRICISAARDRDALDRALTIITRVLGNPAPLIWQTM